MAHDRRAARQVSKAACFTERKGSRITDPRYGHVNRIAFKLERKKAWAPRRQADAAAPSNTIGQHTASQPMKERSDLTFVLRSPAAS